MASKCVCPSCGKVIPLQRGSACPLMNCPVCGIRMICK